MIFSFSLLLTADQTSGHVLYYSQEIKVAKLIQVDSHNCSYTYAEGQASNAALSSPLSNLVDLAGFATSPFWTMFLYKDNQSG